MADALILYSNPMSRGRIVRWMLEEVGQPYQTEMVDYGPAMKQAPYLTINPMGKVPALRHGQVVVSETAAICAYLADAFPAAGLAPPPADRGAYYRWLFFAAGPLEAALSDKHMGVQPTAEQQAMVGYGTAAATLDVLEGAVADLGAGYIAGPAFSAADVYVGAHITWGLSFGTIDKRPAFEAYVARLTARAAYQRANALDDAAMPAAPAGQAGA